MPIPPHLSPTLVGPSEKVLPLISRTAATVSRGTNPVHPRAHLLVHLNHSILIALHRVVHFPRMLPHAVAGPMTAIHRDGAVVLSRVALGFDDIPGPPCLHHEVLGEHRVPILVVAPLVVISPHPPYRVEVEVGLEVVL